MAFTRKHVASAWLAISVISIMFMGIYAFLVALSRAPGVSLLFTDQSFFQTALVTHVVLSVVIWFIAFIIFIVYYVTLFAPVSAADYALAAGAFCGVALIVATPFTGPAQPLLNNYIPVLQRGSYFAGLGLFLVSALLGMLLRAPALKRAMTGRQPEYPLIVTGSLAGAGLSLAAGLACFVISYISLSAFPDMNVHIYYESLFWGGGHTLQFTNALGLMAVWALLAGRNGSGKVIIGDKAAMTAFGIMAVLAMISPLEYLSDPILSLENRKFFLNLKWWGAGIGPIILGLSIVRLLWKDDGDPVYTRGLTFSMGLFVLGGLIALTLSGSDTRVPAHYHGVIGAVTLGFMAFALAAVVDNGWLKVKSKWVKAQLTLYGAGQALFVLGLFIGGLAGLPRKTFGAAQQLDSALKTAGMFVMGIGGLLAVAGGVVFVVLMLKAFCGRDEKQIA